MPRPGTPLIHRHMLSAVQVTAQAGLTDTCKITGPGGERVYDPATKRTSAAVGATIYEGDCAVQPRRNESSVDQLGDEATQVRGYYAAVPIAVTGVERGYTFTVTAIGPNGDPRLVGRTFKVGDVTVDTYGALRDLELEEVGRG